MDIPGLLSALNVFSGAPDKASLDTANSYLQDFQHSSEAWSTCSALLQSPDVPASAKLFAAQSFRTKVLYDLNQIDTFNFPSLRDTLIAALEAYSHGPRAIVVQLCLALADLAVQFRDWSDAVQNMIDSFGKDPEKVPALLQFLTVLPEEMNNHRIPITEDDWKYRARILMTNNRKLVLNMLSMYIQAPGVTNAIHLQVLNCLKSWIVHGELTPRDLVETPLFDYSFEALVSYELFDAAVDVVCEIIHETQEVDDNMPSIEAILAKLVALKSRLAAESNDAERVKGYARIFSEAGDTYRILLVQHTDAFAPIIEAIGQCSAYPDLDVVPITFTFWYRLALMIGKKTTVPQLIVDAYRTLMSVIIRHLHFPRDPESVTPQEMDTFRSFRHVMGDTLKDCCLVLHSETCLLATYEMIASAMSQSQTLWQDVEAPLFALRSMGAEVDANDNTAVPKIMRLLPTLPDHPKVRYAALLIIARYTGWINAHPEYISPQLQYISSGFEVGDPEVTAAAGQALKYLCMDCKQHLGDFLPTLHTFLKSTGANLSQDDKRQVYEAIAFVISARPMEEAAATFRTFAMDILAQVHQTARKVTPATKQEIQESCNGLENLEVMAAVIHSFGELLPTACQNTCQEAWAVLNEFLVKFGSDYQCSEQASRVLRRGLTLFGPAAMPVAASVMARMSYSFESTALSSYLWIAGKLVDNFGNEEDPVLRGSFRELYERSTSKVLSLLQTQNPNNMPDVLEDYLRLLLPLLDMCPDIFFQSSAFPLAFEAALASLTLVQTDVVVASLDIIRNTLTHDSLDLIVSPPPMFPIYAAAIRVVVEKHGYQLLGLLLVGLTGDFPEESISTIVSILRALSFYWSTQLLGWLPQVLEQLPTSTAPAQSKDRFLSDITRAINTKQFDKVKQAVLSLSRASWKARERRRGGVIDG